MQTRPTQPEHLAQPHTAAPPPLWFHLLAGPNGAGKSTLYRALVREGLLDRTQRHIPFARIHNISQQSQFFHRLLGVTVLRLDSAAGGKPEAVIEKMIVGRMNKFFEEVTLLNQKFVMNPDVTVAQAAKDAGVEVTGFARLAVGEGVEKEVEDFAAEVAKTAGR